MPRLIDVRQLLSDNGRGRFDYTRPPRILVWHHTAVFYPLDRCDHAEHLAHIHMIEAYHIRQGYGVFGYHGIAFGCGCAYWTGDVRGARSHVASRNHEATGFCFAGDLRGRRPTAEAIAAARLLRAIHVRSWGDPDDEPGHTDFALPQYPTSCPGAPRAPWIRDIAHPPKEDDMTDEQAKMLEEIRDRMRLTNGPYDNQLIKALLDAEAEAADARANVFRKHAATHAAFIAAERDAIAAGKPIA